MLLLPHPAAAQAVRGDHRAAEGVEIARAVAEEVVVGDNLAKIEEEAAAAEDQQVEPHQCRPNCPVVEGERGRVVARRQRGRVARRDQEACSRCTTNMDSSLS